MSLPIVWQPSAAYDLELVIGYIADFNPTAAVGLHDSIEMAAMRLSMFPYSGVTGRVSGTRELVVHPNYILIYEVTAQAVEIVAVVHSRHEYP